MSPGDSRVLVCPHCGNRTPHKLVFTHEYPEIYYNVDGTPSEGPDPPSEYAVYECGTCHDISLFSYPAVMGFDYGSLVYPPGNDLHESVPLSVARNFQDAKRIQNISPNGFAVLVRRSLEAMCDDRSVPAGTLAKRLETLAKSGEIPPVLAEITAVLRILGNSGAHNTDQNVTVPMTWAMDQFFRAVVEYVYVAPSRLEQFRKKSSSIADDDIPF